MSALLELGRDGRPVTGAEIIDMHCHLGRYGFAIPDRSLETLVRGMDRLGVTKLVTSHMRCMRPVADEAESGNDVVCQAMSRYPGRILGYMTVVPANDAAATRGAVERRLRQGFTGVKLHNGNGIPYESPGYRAVYEVANERCLPVLLHTWGNPAEFAQIHKLAERYPDVSLILAHGGSANPEAYIEAVRSHPWVFMDTTYSISPRGLVERLVTEGGADKVLWGSDAYFYSQSQQFGKILGARLPDEAKLKILGRNAAVVLGRIRDGGLHTCAANGVHPAVCPGGV